MDARTFRLLRLADELLNRQSGDVTHALAECLLEDEDLVTLNRRLDLLDSSHIPPSPLNPKDAIAMDITDKAASVITQLLRVLLALFRGGPEDAMAVCRTKSYKIFLERWHDIVRWLSYFVQNASVSPRFSKVVPTCILFLLSITTVGLEDDPVAEAMVCRKDFGDFTYLLLYQEDSSTGTYYNASPSATSGDTTVLKFVLRCFDAEPTRDFLTTHFISLNRDTQDEVIGALVFRTQMIAKDLVPSNLQKAVKDLQSIMVIFRWLIEASDFRLNSRRHERYIYRLAAAICRWSEKAEAAKYTDVGSWTAACEYLSLLARAVSLPVCAGALGQLIEGGLFPFTARCILHVKSPVAENYLRTATPYLYQLKTYRATMKFGDKRWWDWVCSPSALEKSPQSAHSAWHSVMRYAIRGYHGKEDAPIDMCSNVQHASTPKKSKFPPGPKTCSRCHSVAYCSAACQQADWTHLHARECSTLARRYQDQKSNQAWPSVHRKWDILRFITAYANERFPSPKEILKVTKLSHLTRRNADPSGPTTPLLRFDPNSSVEFVDIYCHKPDELGYYTRMSLQSLYNPQAWRLESILPWLPRFQEFVDAAEQNPTTMILVEGRFRLNLYYAVVMFATMRYDPKKPSLERYTVVNSAFRSILR